MIRNGILLVIDGPSAVGKSTIVRALLAQKEIPFSLAKRVTTRERRAAEDDEDIYDYVSHEEFRRTADGKSQLPNPKQAPNSKPQRSKQE